MSTLWTTVSTRSSTLPRMVTSRSPGSCSGKTDPNALDGRNALMAACVFGHEQVARVLIEALM